MTVFDPQALQTEIATINNQTQDPAVFSDYEKLNQLNKKLKVLNGELEAFRAVEENLQNLQEMAEILVEEPDEVLVGNLNQELFALNKQMDHLYLNVLLGEKHDSANAIVKVHSGAGGTEACDWAGMLFRMYQMWSDKNDFTLNVYDVVDGDGAGYKTVTFEVKGLNAYGYLKGETGVHRLVRISPFDANKRRHTSFASVEVMPEIENDNEITIDPNDIRIDTYRASGAGGQHVNKTDSAIRITHFPSGIVVTCQNERSQLQNRETAMMLLKSKLLVLKHEEQEKQAKNLKGEQKKIEWGSQIRSYVFCPYTMVKDHRTEHETSNVDAVMNGQLDEFIVAYLKWWNE